MSLPTPPPLPTASTDPNDMTVVEVPNGPAVNYLIGTGGATVKILEQASGCRIDVQKVRDMVPGSTVRNVTITHSNQTRRGVGADLVRLKVEEYQEALAKQLAKRETEDPAVLQAEAATKRQRVAESVDYTTQMMSMAAGMMPGTNPLMAQYDMGLAQQAAWGALMMSMPGMQAMPAMTQGGLQPLPAPAGQAVAASENMTVVEVPNGPAVNYIIGARGATVSSLEGASECRIDVQKVHDMVPGSQFRKITIIHSNAANRAYCEQLIRAKVDECVASWTNPSTCAR